MGANGSKCKNITARIIKQKRFKLYQTRDRLAMLAMRGVVSEDSEEYFTLMRLINNTLGSTKDFQITSFIKIHSAIATDEKLREHIENIINRIEDDRLPSEYSSLVQDYFSVAQDIFNHKTWMLKNIFFPAILLTMTILSIIDFFAKTKETLKTIENTVIKISDEFAQDMSRLQHQGMSPA